MHDLNWYRVYSARTPQADGSRDILLRNMHAPDLGKIKNAWGSVISKRIGGGQEVVEMAVGRITAAMALTRRQVGVNPGCNGQTLGGLAESGGQASTRNRICTERGKHKKGKPGTF